MLKLQYSSSPNGFSNANFCRRLSLYQTYSTIFDWWIPQDTTAWLWRTKKLKRVNFLLKFPTQKAEKTIFCEIHCPWKLSYFCHSFLWKNLYLLIRLSSILPSNLLHNWVHHYSFMWPGGLGFSQSLMFMRLRSWKSS